MATLAVLNEKIGANRREFAEVVDARKALYETIDAIESKVDGLSAKADRTEDENKALADLEAELSAKAKEARTLTAKADSLKVEQDKLTAQINERTAFEADLRAANVELPRQTQPNAGDARIVVKDVSAEEMTLDIGRLVQAHYLSFKDRVPVRDVLAGKDGYADFRNDRLLSAATTSNNSAIVPTNYARSFIEYLRANVVVESLNGVRRIPLVNGNLTMPRQATTSTAYWTAEAANATPSDVTTETITLSAKKLFTLVPITGELMRRSDPAIAAMVRDDLVATAARAVDAAFLRNSTSGTPYGLKYIVDNYNSASQRVDATAIASADVSTVTADLGKLQLLLANGNAPNRNRYWVFAPRTEQYLMDLRDGNGNLVFPEMARGMLKGSPYVTTTQIPTNLSVTIGSARTSCSEIYYVEASELLVADTPTMELDVSNTAAYYDGSAVVSAFSKDMVVTRLILEKDFNVRHPVSVAYMQGVDWGK